MLCFYETDLQGKNHNKFPVWNKHIHNGIDINCPLQYSATSLKSKNTVYRKRCLHVCCRLVAKPEYTVKGIIGTLYSSPFNCGLICCLDHPCCSFIGQFSVSAAFSQTSINLPHFSQYKNVSWAFSCCCDYKTVTDDRSAICGKPVVEKLWWNVTMYIY